MLITYIPVSGALFTWIVEGYVSPNQNNTTILFMIYSAVMLIPFLAMIIRRIHDTGNPGIYIVFLLFIPLFFFIPGVFEYLGLIIFGPIFLIVLCMPSVANTYEMYDPDGYND